MYDDYNEFNQTGIIEEQSVNSFMGKVYGWMFLGLLVTALSALLINTFEPIQRVVFNPVVLICVVIAEFALVISVTAGINKISKGAARLMFLVYSSLTGITLAMVCLMYAAESVYMAFFMCSAVFGVMAVVGTVTNVDLSSIGRLLLIGLFGLIVMTIVNLFMKSSAFEMIICSVGLFIFLGLTAYDAQKIKTLFYNAATLSGSEYAEKIAIVGALELYLDFVNIFLYIIRLIGKRK